MQLEVNKIYNGFRLLEQKNVNEVNSTARLFIHEKSGARLFNLENDDDNKVFSISFRTPPKDSTGLPHILEHSVLCGSRKFPAKDPFIELAKGSLNTFLNAMTFPDKTMYPVASRNEKDFFNLMDVYMDAVLYPNIYKYPEIFMQEGWHYELNDKDSDIVYNGVVYNEMKGEFSSPESILLRKIQEHLFPDTPYRFESGGDPDVIPKLTLDDFLAFHKKYYHPSNSYIFLYGNGDILKELDFLNDKYLKNFDRLTVDSKIPVQNPFSRMKEITVDYPISNDENEEDKTFLSLNFVTGSAVDREIYLAFEVLEHLLLETPAAPLKKALIEAGLGKDVLGNFDNSILQPVFSIIVKNSNMNKKDEFRKVVFDTLEGLVRNGIDKQLIEASINVKEFELREADFRGYPKGLLYNIKCMNSWLYDKDPTLHLEYEPALNKIKEALNTNYFEKLIEKYLLQNNHSTLIILKPCKGLSDRRTEEIKKELSDYKAGLSDKELDKIIEDTKKLIKRQSEPDSIENLEKIPLLSLKDISTEAEKLPLVEKKESDIKVLFHPAFTNRIAYVNLLFDVKTVDQKLIPYIGLLSEVLGKMGTEKYSYSDLANQINIHTGGIRPRVEVYVENGDDNKYYPKLNIKSKVLIDKLPKLFELLGEIAGHTKFDDKKRLKEIIMETKSRIEMAISSQGHVVAYKRLLSYFSPAGKYIETITGLEYYKFLSKIEKEFESIWKDVIYNLQETAKSILNRDNLMISIVAQEEDYNEFANNLNLLANQLGCRKYEEKSYDIELSVDNEGLLTPGKVQYVAKGYNYIRLGYSYSGILQVLETIIGLDYLWNHVRVRGGAYGAFVDFDRSGNVYFASYRDPNLKNTLSVYDKVPEYLENFDVTEREMTKYIIGTVSKLDYPLTPSMKGDRAVRYYITHISDEDIEKERREVLGASKEDIRKFGSMLRDVMRKDCYCVVGGEGRIKENENLFKKLINVFE